MVRFTFGPSGAPLGDPGGGRVPNWMLSDDELGQITTLLMRRKQVETFADSQTSNSSQPKLKPLANPFIIGTTIELAVGKDIAKNVWANKEAQGSRYLLRTNSQTAVDKLSKVTKLSDGTEIEVILHPKLNTTQGVVYEPDCTDIDEHCILEYLESQGVKSVRRITKRINDDVHNTPLIVLTFHGTQIPEYVLFGRSRVSVRAYYPSPMVCFNCGDYGHPSKFCRQPIICLQCSRAHEVAKGMKCNNPPHCKHCRGDHPSTSRSCQKYKDETNIIRMQIDQMITPAEARKIYFEKNRKETMASVVQNRLTATETEKDKIIAELRAEVEELKTKLTTVLNEVQSSRSESNNKDQCENSQRTIAEAADAFETNSKDQRLSRKDQTIIPPLTTRSSSKKKGNNVVHPQRSRSKKHYMDISPSDQTQSKRIPGQSNTDEYGIDVDEDE